MKLKLTTSSVAGLEITGQRYDVHDTTLPGFTIRVGASGTKTAAIVYRRGRQLCRYTLGKISEAYPFAKARSDAKDALLTIKNGGDPAADKREARKAPTLADAAERFMAEHVAVHCKERGRKSYETLLRLHVLPALGKRKAAEITRTDIERMHAKIGELHPGAANRALTMCSSLFGKLEDWGIRPPRSNPCYRIKRFKETTRERVLTSEERARLDEVLTDAEQTPRGFEGYVAPGIIAAIRLLILTGARRNEITTLRWEYVDLDRGELQLPDSKTGAKVIPLSAQAVAYLEVLRDRREGDCPWVCATANGERTHGVNRAWIILRKRAGLSDVWLHDLRRSAATSAFVAGVPIGLIGGVLGHKSTQTTARYTHPVDESKRLAALAMGDAIEAQTRAGHEALSNVVPMRRTGG